MAQEKKKGISTFDFFAIGFGAIVGVGWAVSINKWMANCGGPLPASLGYLIALVLMVPVALCYCELAPMLPVAGGGMAYAYRAFNEKVAFISGWAAFGGFVTIIPWDAIYVVDMIASKLFPKLLMGDPLYSIAGADIYLGHLVIGTLLSAVLFFINMRGATSSAMFQRVMCLILIGAGFLTIILSLIKINPDNWKYVNEAGTAVGFYGNVKDVFHSSFFMGAVAILASAPFFLAGFETIPQAIEEASGSVKSVGKTVVLSVSLACIFYALLLFSLGGALPWQEFFGYASDPVAHNTFAAGHLFETVYGGTFGKVVYYIIFLGALGGLITTWNGFMIGSPYLMMGMARANLIPALFAKTHPKYGTPINSLIACFVLSVLGPFLGMGLIDPLTLFSAAGFVLSWLITSSSLIMLRKKEPDLKRPYRIPGGVATAGFAAVCMAVLFILLFIPGNPVYMGTFDFFGKSVAVTWLFLAWFVIGFILYFASAGQRNKLSKEERSASLFVNVAKANQE